MALKAGIVGLPNVGKSTLFNCLSSAKAQAANFPFCTIDAQMGQGYPCPTSDWPNSPKSFIRGRIVPAVCDIVDIAGLVKGASKGEGLGNQFLATSASATPLSMCCVVSTTATSYTWTEAWSGARQGNHRYRTPAQRTSIRWNRIKRVEKIAKVGGDKMAKVEYEPRLLQRCIGTGTERPHRNTSERWRGAMRQTDVPAHHETGTLRLQRRRHQRRHRQTNT